MKRARQILTHKEMINSENHMTPIKIKKFSHMKYLVYFFLLTSLIACTDKTPTKEQQEWLQLAQEKQDELNEQYADSVKSPLTEEDFKTFKNLEFFPIDLKYIVKASFIKNDFPVPFEMETSTDRRPIYQKYGSLYFIIDDVKCELPVYQSLSLLQKEEYKNYIFLPFTDLTNGKESYGGGRFMDLELPLDSEVIVDFNQAYNPYCAYNHKYSCAIPPKENDLKVAIKAGVKAYH